MKRAIISSLLAVALVAGIVVGFSRIPRSWRWAINAVLQHDAPSIRFAVIGDTEGYGDVFQAALTTAKDRGAAFMLHVGDVTANGSADDFTAMRQAVDAVGLPVYAVAGNHDVQTDESRAAFRRFFNEPDFAFEDGSYRFLVLDNADRAVGFAQSTLLWLRQDIAAHPDSRYIVAFHRPFDLPLGSIFGDDETPASRKSNEQLRKVFRGVRLIATFSGHLHLYLPYQFLDRPAYVTGGGGAAPQSVIGNLTSAGRHFLLVTIRGDDVQVEAERLS